jgi:hypothetical protein
MQLKTHFEQVPLEMVEKIVEVESQRRIRNELARGIKKKKSEEDHVETSTVHE